MAEETKKAQAKQNEKTFTEADVKKMIAAAVSQALAEQKAATPIVQVAPKEYVTLLYIGAIASGTVVALGKLGTINRAGMTRDVPKDDFIQSLGTPVMDDLLNRRQLIVVNGLTDEEKDRYGLKYDENEVINQKMFFKIMDYPKEDICRIFAALCPDHQQIVSKMYLTAYFENHDNRVNMETVKQLNKLSKKCFKDGLFTPILEDMGNKLSEDDGQ